MSSLCRSLGLILTLFVTIPALSSSDDFGIEPLKYNCQVILVVADEGGGLMEDFVAEADGGAHGGRSWVFTSGVDEVEVAANHQWLSLSWSRNGETVVAGTTVVGVDGTDHRVLMLFNPKSEEEQVSVNCSKNL